MTQEKVCRGPCKELKLITEYYKDVHARDGKSSICRACQAERKARSRVEAKGYEITLRDEVGNLTTTIVPRVQIVTTDPVTVYMYDRKKLVFSFKPGLLVELRKLCCKTPPLCPRCTAADKKLPRKNRTGPNLGLQQDTISLTDTNESKNKF